jgi:putative MFS transporter
MPRLAGQRLTAYQWKLFVFLGVATFFEGYDFMIITQILPNLRADFGLSEAQGSWVIGAVNIGAIVAYFVVRLADRWGRRTTLMVTIGGYTTFTVLTGFAGDAIAFTLSQFFARVFLLAEWAIAMVYAAEEFPAARRGMVLGVLQGLSGLGAVICAGAMPLLLALPWGWRSAYLVAAVPLIAVAFVRRGLRESNRFRGLTAEARRKARGLFRIWATPYRTRMLQLALIWGLTYVCGQTAIAFWKEFAVADRGWSDADVGRSIAIAALVAMPVVFFVGKLLDVIGRRVGAAIVFTVGAAGAFFSYTLESPLALTVALVFGVFGVNGFSPVLNAYTTELFPTELRGGAFAWSNSLLGRVGYVISPIVVGQFAAEHGWGPAVRLTAIGPLLALVLILVLLPETKNLELEQTSKLPSSP